MKEPYATASSSATVFGVKKEAMDKMEHLFGKDEHDHGIPVRDER
jgi:hypothetical protein